MKFITSIHAYDCLSEVVYAVTVREYEDYEDGESHVALDLRGSFPARGDDRPGTWLREILIAISRDC